MIFKGVNKVGNSVPRWEESSHLKTPDNAEATATRKPESPIS